MNLRPGHKEESVEVNLTPLIDVVFLLLIFFMVSTTFDKHAKLKVTLPEASTKAVQQQSDSLILSIDAKGNYFLNERQVINQKLKTLKQAIQKTVDQKAVDQKAKGKDNNSIAIVLRADANTPHQYVVRAMDAASQLGLTQLSIATVEAK